LLNRLLIPTIKCMELSIEREAGMSTHSRHLDGKWPVGDRGIQGVR
jgi:hypothetical protein